MLMSCTSECRDSSPYTTADTTIAIHGVQ